MLGAFMYMIIILDHPLSFSQESHERILMGLFQQFNNPLSQVWLLWTTSVKYSSIYGIQSVQKIDTGKNGKS